MLFWLILNGYVVWICGLVLLVCLGAYFVWRRPRTRARRNAASEKRLLGIHLGDLSLADENTLVTLGGTLSSRKTCERLEDGAPVLITAMDEARAGHREQERPPISVCVDDLSLNMGDVKIALTGPVDLRAGSQEYHPGLKLNRLNEEIRTRAIDASDGDLPLNLKRRFVFRSLQNGDQVRARGSLLHTVEQGEDRWRLDPVAKKLGGPLALEVVYDGEPLVWGPARFRVVSVVAIYVLAFVLVLAGVGELAIRLADASPEGTGGGAAAGPGEVPYAVAAMTPFHRRAALTRLLDTLVQARSPALERIVTLNRICGRCRQSFALLVGHHRYSEAIEQRKRCPDPDHPRAIVAAYVRLGRFKEASDVLTAHPPPADEAPDRLRIWAEAHLLAGRLKPAAEAVRGLASAADAQAGKLGGAAAAEHEQTVDNITCLAGVLEALAGARDKAALARLGQQTTKHPGCAMMLWDLRARLDRASSARSQPSGPKPPGPRSELHEHYLMLAAEAGQPWTGPVPASGALAAAEQILAPGASGQVADFALRQAALRRLAQVKAPDARTQCYRATLAADLAAAFLLLGDSKQASKMSQMMSGDFGRLGTAHTQRNQRIAKLLERLNAGRLRLVLSDIADPQLAWLRSLRYRRARRVLGALRREQRRRPRSPLNERFRRMLASLDKRQLTLLTSPLPKAAREQMKEAPKDERLKVLQGLLPPKQSARLTRSLDAGYDSLSLEPLLQFVPEDKLERLLGTLRTGQRSALPSWRRQQYLQILTLLNKDRHKLLLSLLPSKTRSWLLTALRDQQPRLLLDTYFTVEERKQRLLSSLDGKELKLLLLDRLEAGQVRRLLLTLKEDQQRELLLAALEPEPYSKIRRFLSHSWSRRLKKLSTVEVPRSPSKQKEQFQQLLTEMDERPFVYLWRFIESSHLQELPQQAKNRLLPQVAELDFQLSRFFNNDEPLARSRRAAEFSALFELRVHGPAAASKLLAPIAGSKYVKLIAAVSELQQKGHSSFLVPRLRESSLWHAGDAKAWEHVSLGLGKELSAWLWERKDLGARFLLAGAGHLRSGKQQLCRWIDIGDAASCRRCSLTGIVRETARRREAARTLGCKEVAARYDQISRRFAGALSRRRFALPLAVLEAWTPLADDDSSGSGGNKAD
jgi:hypothetical protein